MKIVVLPASTCEPEFQESATFCLTTALNEGPVGQIWILGGSPRAKKTIAERYTGIEIKQFQLDKNLTPLDIGSNQMMILPLILYQAYTAKRPSLVSEIYVPLLGASTYFLQMAITGKLIDSPPEIITTCYLPKSFELSGAMILPTTYNNVVTCEMEQVSARLATKICLSSCLVKDEVIDKLSLPLEAQLRISCPEADKQLISASSSQHNDHIIFCGPLTPIYGIDAFCDLAEELSKKKKIKTITIVSPTQSSPRSTGIKRRLSALSVELVWKTSDPEYEALNTLEQGVLISPMRAPILPLSVSVALKAGITCIWGTGFDLEVPSDCPSNLLCTVSDPRKLMATFERIGRNSHTPTLPKPIYIEKPQKELRHETLTRSPVSRLSVVIIHHNRIELLKQTLLSISEQTLEDFEVVLVDDGSDQETRELLPALLQQYGFKQSVFCQIENSYPSAARNHGVMKASGEAVFFIDDDNILAPQTLEVFFRAIQSHDIVLSFYQTFYGEESPAVTHSNSKLPIRTGLTYGFAGLLSGAGLFYNIMGNSSLMIRRDRFIELGGFSPKYGVGLEDYAFLLKASLQRDISWIVLPEPYLHFRLHGNKIRNSHVDWRGSERLQAGHWRLINDLRHQHLLLSTVSLAYARQLHELSHFYYVHSPRPHYFRLKYILLHQYIRPFLAKNKGIRRLFLKFSDRETRIGKWIERLLN